MIRRHRQRASFGAPCCSPCCSPCPGFEQIAGARLHPCRPADRGLWLSLVGAASPPVLIFCKGPSSARHLVTLKSSSLTDGSVWGAELRRHTSPDLEESTAPHAGLPALAAAHVLMAAMHGVSRVELLARRFAQGLRAITRLVGWHHVLIVAMGLTSLWSFKIILDALSATDGAAQRHAAAAAALPLLPAVLLLREPPKPAPPANLGIPLLCR